MMLRLDRSLPSEKGQEMITTPAFAATSRKVATTLQINGQKHEVLVENRRTLLDTLRDVIGLTGTKKGCDVGNCGACTVIVDGRTQYSCLMLAVGCEGKEIRTIEGLASEEKLHPVQEAFIEEDAFQCGFCTPGQIMSLRALLDTTPAPTDEQIMRAVSGNLCRCGAYHNILKAGRRAAELQHVVQGERHADPAHR